MGAGAARRRHDNGDDDEDDRRGRTWNGRGRSGAHVAVLWAEVRWSCREQEVRGMPLSSAIPTRKKTYLSALDNLNLVLPPLSFRKYLYHSHHFHAASINTSSSPKVYSSPHQPCYCVPWIRNLPWIVR
ncbi:hypothetical protein Pelo_18319 [Pelomyxa schiedti]|nr:hypothetical protein Pelo_18319 [Pelomyxa schiedti]